MTERAKRLILFAHGAGAPSSSAWMRAWAKRLGACGKVVRFDYPYMTAKKRRPDPQPALIAAHRAALAKACRGHRGRVVLAGKSLGGRMGCHLALETPVDALVCLGYPLRGQTGKLRDEVLRALETPILFVQGTRDPLCSLDELERVRREMRAPNELHVVENGDHSLGATKTWLAQGGRTQADLDAAALAVIEAFLERYAR